MNKRELINRWRSVEGQILIGKVIRSLTSNKDLSTIDGLEKTNYRWDLRGAPLSQLSAERKVKAKGHELVQKFGTLKASNTLLQSIDFSFAELSYSRWRNCTFDNCIFEETVIRENHFMACDFINVQFNKANLYKSFMNQNIGANAGSFINVQFTGSNLSKCIFSFPVIKQVEFKNCNLLETDFDGSRLENCVFTGLIDSAWFRGSSRNARLTSFLLFNRINPKDFPNRMQHVNFVDADIVGVSFIDGIDLRNCVFPKTDNKYILINDVQKVYSKARQIIESEWEGEYKRRGLFLIDNLYYATDKRNQSMDFIDTLPLKHDDEYTIEFNKNFYALIRNINENSSQY